MKVVVSRLTDRQTDVVCWNDFVGQNVVKCKIVLIIERMYDIIYLWKVPMTGW